MFLVDMTGVDDQDLLLQSCLRLLQSDSWFVPPGAKTENTKSAITPELMAGSFPNFYHRYI
jgi:hypothetical protein